MLLYLSVLFCCKCGRAFNENEVESFNPIADAMMHYDEVVASPKQKRLCCPKCKSNHLQAIVETATSARTIGNGYSPAKGCLGSLLFGSGGWLLMALGQRQRTIIETQNRNYWICNDCGYKFRNTEDWHEEIKKKEQAVKVNLVLTIFFIIVAMLLFTGGEVSSVVGIVFLIIGAVNAITFFLGKTRIQNELQHLDDLESSSME